VSQSAQNPSSYSDSASWPAARTNILSFQHYYLVGIKGVAMTSLAECLLDAGKSVSGSDLPEEFVTQASLEKAKITVDSTFSAPLPPKTDCVIYTAAHDAQLNPQVVAAQKAGIPVWSQAEAIAGLANQKKVIAVCGVGGKSTVSAMIAWILEKTGQNPSYSVGVGSILGLSQTGRWRPESEWFVIEADEYVTDPAQARLGKNHVPRFAYLEPTIIVCTNIRYDHPDVYRNFDHTVQTYQRFFAQLKPGGVLIYHAADATAKKGAETLPESRQAISFGQDPSADFALSDWTSENGKSTARLTIQSPQSSLELSLPIPGVYNLVNAASAVAAAVQAVRLGTALTADSTQSRPAENTEGIKSYFQAAVESISQFRSTKRRVEFLGEVGGIRYYDDYAHHPSELAAVISAFQDWYPDRNVYFSFQPHTYSRTKELFPEFIDSLSLAKKLVLLEIFSSARELADPEVTSKKLAEAITDQTDRFVACVQTIPELAAYYHAHLQPGDICVTLGAGDIYEVHSLLGIQN